MTQTNEPPTRCLILGCGNTLRGDDGIGPSLCTWAERRFSAEPHLRVILRQQWTPELAEDIAAADAVIFIDCSLESGGGIVQLTDVQPASALGDLSRHHLDAAALLALALQLYGERPHKALQLTVGGARFEFGEELSPEAEAALPNARSLLELTVGFLLQPELQRA